MPAMESHYPGEFASPDMLRALAAEYRDAAHLLRERGRRGRPLTWAPFRLAAIQAIELYLTAFLLDRGLSPAQVRAMQHDLGSRSKAAAASGLSLRLRTAEHLVQLSRQREYLVSRYAPDLVTSSSQINRLSATLDEVAKKTVPAARGVLAAA